MKAGRGLGGSSEERLKWRDLGVIYESKPWPQRHAPRLTIHLPAPIAPHPAPYPAPGRVLSGLVCCTISRHRCSENTVDGDGGR
jgi:hypothetical protein